MVVAIDTASIITTERPLLVSPTAVVRLKMAWDKQSGRKRCTSRMSNKVMPSSYGITFTRRPFLGEKGLM